MRFIIKQTGVGSERIGQLTGFIKSPNSVIETPTAALFTQAGSVVNLTAEVLAKVFTTPQLLWVPLSNSVQLENGLKAQNEGLAEFAGLSEHFACVSLQSVSEPTPHGHYEHEKIPLWTKNGKKLITADRYMDLMELYKPDMYMTIADGHTSLNEGKKRIAKSIERSSKTLIKCVERHKSSNGLKDGSLIGVIVGTANDKRCYEFIEQLLKHQDTLCGVTLQGLTDGSDESFNVTVEHLDSIFQKIGTVLPDNLLRIIEGCWSPTVILAAIDRGWDLFDGSYPVKLTNAGYALRLNFDISTSDSTPYFLNLNDSAICRHVQTNEATNLALRSINAPAISLNRAMFWFEVDSGVLGLQEPLNIRWTKRWYKEDFTPILTGCQCLACRKHTRAYIRHLLNTREMLANVLLSIHNLYHFDQFFYHARRHIAEKTFEAFKQHITHQCNAVKLVIPIPKEKPDIPDEAPTPKNEKKKKIENVEVSNSDSVDMARDDKLLNNSV